MSPYLYSLGFLIPDLFALALMVVANKTALNFNEIFNHEFIKVNLIYSKEYADFRTNMADRLKKGSRVDGLIPPCISICTLFGFLFAYAHIVLFFITAIVFFLLIWEVFVLFKRQKDSQWRSYLIILVSIVTKYVTGVIYPYFNSQSPA